MRAFEHVDATSVEDAIVLLQTEAHSAIIAGGTDLLVLMKDGLLNPRVLINIKSIDGLGRVEANASGLRIGSLATMTELGENPGVQRDFPILADAIGVAASPQIRNVATVGGNLCQRPRCWYYRESFDCFFVGGNRCFASGRGARSRASSAPGPGSGSQFGIFGGAECYAVNPSDLAPPLAALGASVVLQGPNGRRQIPLEQFFTAPGKDLPRQVLLGRDEIIVEIAVPKQPDGSRGAYLKAMDRKAWSFAQASVAVQVSLSKKAVAEVRIVLGGVAPVPWRARGAEDVLRGKVPTEDLIEVAANAAVEGANPLGSNGYKVALVKELVRRGVSTVVRVSGGK